MYTMSKDGRLRANLHFKLRFEKDELAEMNEMARYLGHEDFRAYAQSYLLSVTDNLYDSYRQERNWMNGS